jgi:diaminopimelate epimerase
VKQAPIDAWPFLKGHGTGNDFVLLPDPEGRIDLTVDQVRLLCDRRFGVGGDGILRVVPAALAPEAAGMATDAAYFMDYRNSDGSTAEMCGNGIRVFARYLVSAGLVSGGRQRIATRGGVREVDVEVDGRISVDLGVWQAGTDASITVGGISYSAVGISLPNPHLVAEVIDLEAIGSLQLAPTVRPETAYPNGVNVEFVARRGPGHLAMRVHERGSGETLSCGTGAAAVGVAAARQDSPEEPIDYRVDVRGGTLHVTVAGQRVWLRGPAEIVAHGYLEPGWDRNAARWPVIA